MKTKLEITDFLAIPVFKVSAPPDIEKEAFISWNDILQKCRAYEATKPKEAAK